MFHNGGATCGALECNIQEMQKQESHWGSVLSYFVFSLPKAIASGSTSKRKRKSWRRWWSKDGGVGTWALSFSRLASWQGICITVIKGLNMVFLIQVREIEDFSLL